MTYMTATPGKKFNNQKLIFYAMLLSSAALSIVSAYETYLGLLDFMGSTFFGKVASGILTFGIQVLLFAISWSIANHLKDGFRANIPRWIIWVLCAFFSGYFSYYGFFETTGGRNDDVRMSAVNREVSGIYRSAEERLVKILEEQHAALIGGDDAKEYQDWVGNHLRRVIEVANDPNVEVKIADAARAARTRLWSDRDLQRNELTPLKAQQARVRVELEQSNSALDGLRTRQGELAATIYTLRGELQDAEAQVISLEVEYNQELQTGTGPRSRGLELDLNSARGARDGLVQRLANAEADLAELLEQIASDEAVAAEGAEQTHLNEIDGRITVIESEIARVETELEAVSRGVNFDFRTQTQDFELFREGLVNKDYSKLADLVNQCAVLKQQLIEAGLVDEVADVACSNTVIAQGVSGLVGLQDKLQAFSAQCMADRPQPERAGPDAPAQIDAMLAHLDGCVDFVADTRESDAFKTRVAALNAQRGDNVEPITEASVALFKDRQGNAVMSAIFAIIVDVLVLFCALVGLNVGLPERARAIDLILNRARKPVGAGPNVEQQINIGSMEPNKQAMIDPVISDLLRQGLAEYTDDDGNQLNLLRGATARLRQMREQEVSDAAAHLDGSGTRRPRPGRPGVVSSSRRD
jgi:hypothetical protein